MMLTRCFILSLEKLLEFCQPPKFRDMDTVLIATISTIVCKVYDKCDTLYLGLDKKLNMKISSTKLQRLNFFTNLFLQVEISISSFSVIAIDKTEIWIDLHPRRGISSASHKVEPLFGLLSSRHLRHSDSRHFSRQLPYNNYIILTTLDTRR